MKKYKYPFFKKILRRKAKERFKQLSRIQKRNFVINKIVGYAFVALYFLMVIALVVLTLIISRANINNILKGFLIVGMVILTVFLPLVVIALIYKIVHKRIPQTTMGKLNMDAIKRVTQPLVSYYKIPDNYVVVKCYSSSKPLVVNEDVILFVNDGKMRITNDFFHSIKDFGCYEFDYQEITCFNKVENGIVKTFIKSDGAEFVLSYKARTFIKKNCEKSSGS